MIGVTSWDAETRATCAILDPTRAHTTHPLGIAENAARATPTPGAAPSPKAKPVTTEVCSHQSTSATAKATAKGEFAIWNATKVAAIKKTITWSVATEGSVTKMIQIYASVTEDFVRK